MPVTRRMKRRLEEPNPVELVTKKRTFSNVTNLNSPVETTAPGSKRKITRRSSRLSQMFSRQLLIEKDVASQKMDETVQIVAQIPPEKSSGDSNENVIKLLQSVKTALVLNFKDFVQRLQLDYTPTHLYDLRTYQLLCSKNYFIKEASSGSASLAKSYLNEDRHIQFIHHVKHNMCGQKEFPGADTILDILQLILVSSFDSFESLTLTIFIVSHRKYQTTSHAKQSFRHNKLSLIYTVSSRTSLPCFRLNRCSSHTPKCFSCRSKSEEFASTHQSLESLTQCLIYSPISSKQMKLTQLKSEWAIRICSTFIIGMRIARRRQPSSIFHEKIRSSVCSSFSIC